MKRRRLFKGAAVAGLLGVPLAAPARTTPLADDAAMPKLPVLEDPGVRRGDMLYRKLGQTGEIVSAIGFGGSHFAKPGISADESVWLCHAAIDGGITFLDNSWDYNDGDSEIRMGRALSEGGCRDKVFLMTKVDGRNRDIATRQLEQSLTRLRTDRIDLWMFHEVLRYDDPDRIFDPDGALQAALDARKAGKIRFIGFTGHKDPRIHLYMLEVARRHGFRFDVVLMPSNVMDAHFRSFARLAMPVALRDGTAVITMKPFGGSNGVILKAGTGIAPIDCLHYALNRPTSVVITGIDNRQALDQAFEAARSFRPMDEATERTLLARTEAAAADGGYELFKTTAHFDGTAQHPEWLGGETARTATLAPHSGG